ncbi:unnamed protein product [Darwinula stevensoni]|uniref:Phosphatidic acid phosphatase type 2/haloperoxidase domain-containing protein n=1 Tax=Darwinula stevensoni TaxID=69355 RepID=A0A7R8X1W2_9CRUS|nr:unnamed protein product [Darwinula stevensoni]CAG0883182.1 unnamed protein product [Darwinula stevensoni]
MSIPNIAKNQAILNISETSILVVSFLLPLLLIFIGQFLEYVVYQVTRRGPGTESIVMRTFHILGLFLLGIFGTSLILDSMKRMYSYPRPYMGITCGNSSIPNSCWIEPSCGLFHDWTSFPSHNAGISFFALLFLSLYVYHHHLARSWKIARTVFMGGLILMALVFGASRIQLHENHHQDVWVGSVIGGALALAIMITLRGGKDEDATMERMRRILESPRMIPPVSLSKPPVGMEDPDAMGFTNPAYLRDPSRRPAPGHGFPNNQQ